MLKNRKIRVSGYTYPMERDEERSQVYMYMLEKKFVSLPPLKLSACSPTWACRKLYGRAEQPSCFVMPESIGRISVFTAGI